MFASVFLLLESCDGMWVATDCVAEIRLPGLGKGELASGSHGVVGNRNRAATEEAMANIDCTVGPL